jgi:signal transduction histidine kinase
MDRSNLDPGAGRDLLPWIRLMAMLLPATFLLGLLVLEDQFEQMLSKPIAIGVSLLVAAVGIVVFTIWIFSLIKGLQRQLAREAESLVALQARERAGMDVHDGTIQNLFALGLKLENCIERMKGEPEVVRQELDQVVEQMNRVILDIRRSVFESGPALEQSLKLQPSRLRSW